MVDINPSYGKTINTLLTFIVQVKCYSPKIIQNYACQAIAYFILFFVAFMCRRKTGWFAHFLDASSNGNILICVITDVAYRCFALCETSLLNVLQLSTLAIISSGLTQRLAICFVWKKIAQNQNRKHRLQACFISNIMKLFSLKTLFLLVSSHANIQLFQNIALFE